MEAFQKDDDEFEEDYKDGSSLNDTLLRKIEMLHQRCIENERRTKRLKMELKLSTSTARQTKHQIRNDYNWEGKEANFVDSVLSFAMEYLFPRFKFLKDGWMDYDKGQDSFSTFVQGKVQIPEGADYKGPWERVICPTIQAKYFSIRCNLNNEIRRTYKSKCIQGQCYFYITNNDKQLILSFNR